ncbi:MAG: hypothetical protein ACYDAK_13290 [Candidatus Limnocylindrales bacterium]
MMHDLPEGQTHFDPEKEAYNRGYRAALEMMVEQINNFKIKSAPEPNYSPHRPMDAMSYNSALSDLLVSLKEELNPNGTRGIDGH